MPRSAKQRHHRYHVFIQAGGRYGKQLPDSWARPYKVNAKSPAEARTKAKKLWKKDYVDTPKIPPKVLQTLDETKRDERDEG
jgi:hypothetical protein